MDLVTDNLHLVSSKLTWLHMIPKLEWVRKCIFYITIARTNSINPDSILLFWNRILWSRPIPLGWYFSPQWKRFEGDKWAHERCNNWINYDRQMQPFTYELPICPCMMHQAASDKGRYVPDFECDRYGINGYLNPYKKPRHKLYKSINWVTPLPDMGNRLFSLSRSRYLHFSKRRPLRSNALSKDAYTRLCANHQTMHPSPLGGQPLCGIACLRVPKGRIVDRKRIVWIARKFLLSRFSLYILH